jgi:hypothetical protein
MSVETFRFAPLEPVAAPPAAPGTVPLPYGAGSTAFAGAPGGTVPAVPGGTVPAVAAVDVEALVAEARAEGYAEGAADARGTIEPAVAALHGVAAELAGLRERIAEQTERAAVDLAMKIAEQVVRSAIDADRERIVDVVRGGLRRLVERERVIVLVNPDDLDTVREHMRRARRRARRSSIASCRPTAASRRGGACVRNRRRRVDPRSRPSLLRPRVIEHELAGMTTTLDVAGRFARRGPGGRPRRPAPPPRPRQEPIGLVVEATGLEAEVGVVVEIDAGRGGPACPRGRRLPRRSHAAHAAGRDARHRARQPVTPTGRPVRVRVGDGCSAASSTASATRSTAARARRARRPRRRGVAARRARARAHHRAHGPRRPRARHARPLRAAASASASSPARAWASPRCSA